MEMEGRVGKVNGRLERWRGFLVVVRKDQILKEDAGGVVGNFELCDGTRRKLTTWRWKGRDPTSRIFYLNLKEKNDMKKMDNMEGERIY